MSAQAIADFKTIAGVDAGTAEKYLRKFAGSLDRALDAFFDGSGGLSRAKLESFFSSLSNGSKELSGDNLITLCNTCKTPAEDTVWLAVATECTSKTMGRFTSDEWVTGMRALRVDSLPSLTKALSQLKSKLNSDPEYAKKVYRFTFGYALEAGTRNISKEDALALWELLLSPRGWPLYAEWISFVQEHMPGRSISRDTWNMVWDLAHSVKPDLSDYDVGGAWPVAIDDFVDLQRKKST